MKTRILCAAVLFGGLACGEAAQATTFDYTGAQVIFTAGATGVYDITALGAAGGNGISPNYPNIQGFAGGQAAYVGGDFTLTAGQQLTILVGGPGAQANAIQGNGGGGGSFVVLNGTALLIAGGGGGAGVNGPGDNARTGTSGGGGVGNFGGEGGSPGHGGQAGAGGAGGGGGLSTDGSGEGGGNFLGGDVLTGGQGGAGPAFSGGGGGGYAGGGAGGVDNGGLGLGGGGGSSFVSALAVDGFEIADATAVHDGLGASGLVGINFMGPLSDGGGSGGGGAVPEPATWAMMLAGFFGAGGALRRRGRTQIPAA